MYRSVKYLLLNAVAIALFISSCTCPCRQKVSNADEIVAQAMEGLELITSEDLKQKMDSLDAFYLIDVRELNEFAYGYISGAINIPGGVLIFKMENEGFWDNEMIYPPEKTDELIVYCKKGKRSVIAVNYLERLGYENVKFLEGGWKAWEMAYPLEYEENLEIFGSSHDEEDAGGC